MNHPPHLSTNGSKSLATNPGHAINVAADGHGGSDVGDNPNFYLPNTPDESSFDWQRLSSIIRRRKKVMALTVAVSVALAAFFISISPKIYKASADLLINTSGGNSGGEQLLALSQLQEATSTRSQETEVEILRSATVQLAALDLMPKNLRRNIKGLPRVSVDAKRSTDIISISVQSQIPDVAIAFSNAVCEAYRQQSQQNSTEQYRETAKYVGGQLELVRHKLDQKRREFREFKENNHLVDLESESQARVTRLQTLESTLQQNEADRVSNEAQLSVLRSQKASMAPDKFTANNLVLSPVVQQLKSELTNLEAKRIETLQEFTENSPEVKALDEQISGFKRRLQSEAQTTIGGYTRDVNPLRQGTLQNIATLQASIWASQARSRALQQQINSSQQAVGELPEKEYRLSQLQSDLATYQATYQSLSDKYQTLLISMQTPISNARVITPARSAVKISPRVMSTLFMSVLGGLLTALLLAMGIDALDNKIYTEEDAIQITGLPVLTHIPLVAKGSTEPLLISSTQTSTMLESFRMLRTQLSFISSYGHMQTLVVTSSQPGEGKSTVAANLAAAFALNGKKVILIDTDLRRPRVHTVFNVENTRGFTNVVAGICTLEEALQPSGVEGLQLLTSGPMPPNPPELLDSRAARETVAYMKTIADYVIIDAPPAHLLADAQIAATMSDGVLLVVSCQEARRGAVERTCELMAQTGVKIVGMVLNKFTSEQGGYYDYDYYGYRAYLESPSEEKTAEKV